MSSIILGSGCVRPINQDNYYYYDPTERVDLANSLVMQGVKVIRVGDDRLFVLPSDRFFIYKSPNIQPARYKTLHLLAELLSTYPNTMIKVAGYTDNLGRPDENLGLSRQRAQNMASYLKSIGIDQRYIYAVGYGEKYPIATNETLEGRYANRRVEISLRKLPV